MWVWVLATGALVSVMSLVLLVRTEALAGLLSRVVTSRWLYGAALLRLLLGAALIAAADAVRYPQAVSLIGWLMALGGLLLVAVPEPAVAAVAARFSAASPGIARLWLGCALLLGVFLVYAALA